MKGGTDMSFHVDVNRLSWNEGEHCAVYFQWRYVSSFIFREYNKRSREEKDGSTSPKKTRY